jgi:hypothetical protein
MKQTKNDSKKTLNQYKDCKVTSVGGWGPLKKRELNENVQNGEKKLDDQSKRNKK